MAARLDNPLLLVLDRRLSIGVVTLDRDGAVVFLDDSAGALLDERDGLLLERGRLVATAPGEAAAFHALLCGACATARGPHAGGGALHLPRRTRIALTVIAVPLRWPERPDPVQMPAALVLLSDPEREPARGESLLARNYGFTPSEREVALLVLHGARAEDVARTRGTTLHTARTHIKRVLAKAGVQSQVELVRLLLGGHAPTALAPRHAGRLVPPAIRPSALSDVRIAARVAR